MPRKLTPTELADRLRRIGELAGQGFGIGATATVLGIASHTLTDFLDRHLDSHAWPPDPEELHRAADRVAKGQRPRGIRPSRVAEGDADAPKRDPVRIAAMVDEAAAKRAAHEAYWLKLEAERYRLPRCGRPLSEMIA